MVLAPGVKALRAVEPSEGMREVWSKNVQDSRATVIEGTFDSTHVPAGWADLIVIAQVSALCMNIFLCINHVYPFEGLSLVPRL